MANDYFQFKQFTIYQGRCAMKVGTDGVLLGSWADLTESKHILDIGTGTGLIALMAAQRNSQAQIDAIEIDEDACKQALENVQASPWQNRINIFHGRIQDFQPEHSYDSILCNPPFFGHSTPTPLHSRTIARHCETLTHEELLQHAKRLLTPTGKLCVILPVQETTHFIKLSQEKEWFINKLINIFPTPQKQRKRCMLELSCQKGEYSEEDLIIENKRHIYHESFQKLVKDFYLHL